MKKIYQIIILGFWVMLAMSCGMLTDLRNSIFGKLIESDKAKQWVYIGNAPSHLKMVAAGEYLFIREIGNVQRIKCDFSDSWTTIFSTNRDIDSENNDLYVSYMTNWGFGDMSQNIQRSTNFGNSYFSVWSWGADDTTCFDIQNGVGWCSVNSWGARSGMNRFDSNGAFYSNYHWIDNGLGNVVADAVDPVVYYYTSPVLYSVEENGYSATFTASTCSTNHSSYFSLGFSISALTKYNDMTDGLIFAARSDSNKGILMKKESQNYNQWENLGLGNISVVSLAICQTMAGNYLFAMANNGDIYRWKL